jgi:GAF domain-containing protein
MANGTHVVANPRAELSVVDKLRLLLDITKKISRSLDLEEVLNLVMDTLGSVLHYDAAGIYITVRELDPKLDPMASKEEIITTFRTEVVRGYDIEELLDLRLKVGEGIVGFVAQKGEPVISPDVRTDPRYCNAREKTHSEWSHPLSRTTK